MLREHMQNILDIRVKHRGRLFFLPLIVAIIIIGGIVACSNRTQSYDTNSGQDDIQANLSEITVDDLDLTVNPGVEVKKEWGVCLEKDLYYVGQEKTFSIGYTTFMA